MNKPLQVIGDVHGKINDLIHIVKSYDGPSLQIGDLGFNYEKLAILNPDTFKFFAGNHDNYNSYFSNEYALGNFGPVAYGGGREIFYIRGGLSIDRNLRTAGFDYFYNEELNQQEMQECFDLYCSVKPRIVISHEAPSSVVDQVSQFSDEQIKKFFKVQVPSKTSIFLQTLIEAHLPEMYIFGHFHATKSFIKDGCEFICLGELESMFI
jgi:hypothetical protein